MYVCGVGGIHKNKHKTLIIKYINKQKRHKDTRMCPTLVAKKAAGAPFFAFFGKSFFLGNEKVEIGEKYP